MICQAFKSYILSSWESILPDSHDASPAGGGDGGLEQGLSRIAAGLVQGVELDILAQHTSASRV